MFVEYLAVLSLLSLHHARLCQASQEYLGAGRWITRLGNAKLDAYLFFPHPPTDVPGIPGIPVQVCGATRWGADNESRAQTRRK